MAKLIIIKIYGAMIMPILPVHKENNQNYKVD